MRIALLVKESSGQGTDADAIEAELRSAGAEVVSPAGGAGAGPRAATPSEWSSPAATATSRQRPRRRVRSAFRWPWFPSGTANDFARRMRLPSETADACRLAVRGKRVRRLDLAFLAGRPFVNVAAAGLSPAATDRAGPLKPVLGPAAYLASALRAAPDQRPIRCAVRCDGRGLFAGEAWQVMIGCSGPSAPARARRGRPRGRPPRRRRHRGRARLRLAPTPTGCGVAASPPNRGSPTRGAASSSWSCRPGAPQRRRGRGGVGASRGGRPGRFELVVG